MNRELPSRPSLEYLRKEAKQLLAQARANEPEALARFAVVTTSGRPSLHHAQLALAREYGCASWRDLTVKVRSTETDGFLKVVCGDKFDDARKAKAPPEHVRMGNIWVAAACGDVDALEHLVRKDKRLAIQLGGPMNAPPLVYLCFSRLGIDREEVFAEAAEFLLDNGADPNSSFRHPVYTDSPFSVLYGAAGVVHNPLLVELLLQRGANVNDGESLYHSTETRNHECLQLLLAAKPEIRGSNALFRMLDFDDIEGLRLLLDAGAPLDDKLGPHLMADGPINHAIRRGRGREHIELLLDRGAEASRITKEGLTSYGLALRQANMEAAEVLRERGFVPEERPVDRFLLACAQGDLAAAKASGFDPANLSPYERDALVEAAWNHCLPLVRTMVEAGFPIDHQSTEGGHTALHAAAWKGDAAIVQFLLDRGAPLNIKDRRFDATEFGWAQHGSQNAFEYGVYSNPDADYEEATRLLLAAGSTSP